jgi:hypothetical protein
MIPPRAQMLRVPKKAARDQLFECSDCGKMRPNRERLQCVICGETVCDWCEERHLRQHPKEAWR